MHHHEVSEDLCPWGTCPFAYLFLCWLKQYWKILKLWMVHQSELLLSWLYLCHNLYLMEFALIRKPYLFAVDYRIEVVSLTVELRNESVSDSKILSLCQQLSFS